ncbi:MAG TPA: hydroxyphenylacetyl-CoA thioesterase PaaI [Jatrophihabitans sp.]
MLERQGDPVDPVASMIDSDAASRALGITVDSWGEGRASARMIVRADMVNGYEIAHGGLVFALADTAFAAACNSVHAPTVAADADITFVAPARLGDELTATAALRTEFGRNAIYDVTVCCGDQVVAEFRGRSHRLKN